MSGQLVTSCESHQGAATERSKSLKTNQHDTAYLRQRRLLESCFGILGNIADPEESGGPPSCVARTRKATPRLVAKPLNSTRWRNGFLSEF